MSSNQRFQALIASDRIQVFLLACPGNIPFAFSIHPWFVVNRYGSLARWEVLFRQKASSESWGHLHKNFLDPWSGLGLFPYLEHRFAYPPTLVGYCENEIARGMAECIEKSPQTYPYRFRFFLTGPNSNTYAQWILDHAPENTLKLPWNAFGKHYTKSS